MKRKFTINYDDMRRVWWTVRSVDLQSSVHSDHTDKLQGEGCSFQFSLTSCFGSMAFPIKFCRLWTRALASIQWNCQTQRFNQALETGLLLVCSRDPLSWAKNVAWVKFLISTFFPLLCYMIGPLADRIAAPERQRIWLSTAICSSYWMSLMLDCISSHH